VGYDGKYGKVTTEYGEIPDDEPVIVFRGRDKLLPQVLTHYKALCQQNDTGMRHVGLVQKTLDRIAEWQLKNPDKVRTPDSERSRAWMEE
jgi:hypothetical protein